MLGRMRRNLILTTVHRIGFPAIAPFFRSLERTSFAGDVVVFCSAMDHESIRQIEAYGARVMQFRFYGRHVRNRAARLWWIWKRFFASGTSDRTKEQLAHFVFHLFYRRHLLYLDFLREHRGEYEKILLTDCRDVFFQSDLFAWPQSPGLHVFLEDNASGIGACEFNGQWIRNLFGEATFQELATKVVSCAGTVFGDEAAVTDYLQQMVRTTMQVISMRSIDGDQGVHNYLVHTDKLRDLTIHPNRQGPVMTVGPMKFSDLRLTPDKRIVNEIGKIPPVIHQYDRIPELAEVFLSQIQEPE